MVYGLSRLSCLIFLVIFLVQFGAVLMRHRGNNGHNGQFTPFLCVFVDAVLLCGHYGHITF